MGRSEEDLVKELLERDEEFKQAYLAHEEYEKKIAEFDKRPYLSTEEQLTRKKLQKLKLAEKDKMEAILARYRANVK